MNLFPNLTPLQKQKLLSQNIKNLYDLITYFPYKLEYYLPLEQIFKTDEKLFTGSAKLLKISTPKSGFSILNFQTRSGLLLNTYYFGPAKVIYNSLKIDQNYHIRIQKTTKGFLILLNFKPDTGKNEPYPNLLPRYSRLGNLDTKFFRSVFERLDDKNFILNLSGLFPTNELVPNVINLKNIHLPKTKDSFYKTLESWQNFQSLLDLYFLNHINDGQIDYTKKIQFDLKNMEKIIKNIPYALSPSQAQAIEKITASL